MICADTNCWIRFWAGDQCRETELLAAGLKADQVVIAPPVISELVSSPLFPLAHEADLLRLALLPLDPGYWHRAGKTRLRLYQHGLRPKLLDTLIAQLCIDHGVPLLTMDRDFSGFSKHAGLRLA